MRVALAGLGTAATRGHLPAIGRLASEGALTLVGAADPDARARADVGAALPAVPLFESADAMLGSVPCDLFVVAADPRAHAELIALGLARGLHIVCEKPLVLTKAGYATVASAQAARPELGLVAVHQYRYSPTWVTISRWARLAVRLHLPFSLVVKVSRKVADPLATSPWRSDVASSGGILADHGVHYLALAWMLDEHLDVLAGARATRATGERSGATVRIGSGVLTIEASTGNSERHTSASLHVANIELRWRDRVFELVVRGRTVVRRRVATLADRSHVDSLYVPFYRDVARNLTRPAWRVHRTAEALVVARALLELLDQLPPSPSGDARSGVLR